LESIICPGCQKSIRVPDDVLGKRAQCPFCTCQFRAPVRTPGGELTAAVLLRKNPFAESRSLGPGVLLMVVGLLSTLTTGVDIARASADPEAFAAKTREYFDQLAENRKSPELREFGETTLRWLPVARVLFLSLGLLTAAGGLSMIRQRRHGLAMMGSVAAFFNVYCYICFLGFPIGGWCLFVLMDPEVRKQFR
jgi:hypothetical protein